MKTVTTDILRICKGHYNQEKYETIYDALIAYQSKITGCEVKQLGPYQLLNFIYYHEVDLFLSSLEYRCMIKNHLLKDYEMSECCGYPKFEFSIKYLLELYITQLSLLNVYDTKNNEWLIDLSDYEKSELVI